MDKERKKTVFSDANCISYNRWTGVNELGINHELKIECDGKTVMLCFVTPTYRIHRTFLRRIPNKIAKLFIHEHGMCVFPPDDWADFLKVYSQK